MRIIGAYGLTAQETNLITLGKGTVWGEVRDGLSLKILVNQIHIY